MTSHSDKVRLPAVSHAAIIRNRQRLKKSPRLYIDYSNSSKGVRIAATFLRSKQIAPIGCKLQALNFPQSHGYRSVEGKGNLLKGIKSPDLDIARLRSRRKRFSIRSEPDGIQYRVSMTSWRSWIIWIWGQQRKLSVNQQHFPRVDNLALDVWRGLIPTPNDDPIRADKILNFYLRAGVISIIMKNTIDTEC